MKKKETIEIKSLEQFERIYLPKTNRKQIQETSPFDQGVALATLAIEKLNVQFR